MINTLLLLITYLFVAPINVQAYLDPGTGSYITQVIIGFAAGGAYLFKAYWGQIRSFLDKKKKTKKDEEKSK